MVTSEVLINLVAAVAGGGVSSYFIYKIANKKQGTSDFQVVIENYKTLLDKFEEKIANLEFEISEMRKVERLQSDELSSLRSQLLIFESSHSDIPLPMWLKDQNGKMLFVNRYYEDTFLIPFGKTGIEYVGKTDYDIWSKEVADGFVKNDQEVMRNGDHMTFIEKLEDKNGNF